MTLNEALQLATCTDYVPNPHEQAEASSVLAAEVKRLQTWDGLITILDKHYPADVPLVSDPAYGKGPQLVAMIREVNQLQQTCDEFRCASLLVGVAGDAEGVQPRHVESHISELRAKVERLQQQYAELYAATWLCPMDEAVENRQEGHAETIAEITVDVADAYNWREHREFEPAGEANAKD